MMLMMQDDSDAHSLITYRLGLLADSVKNQKENKANWVEHLTLLIFIQSKVDVSGQIPWVTCMMLACKYIFF